MFNFMNDPHTLMILMAVLYTIIMVTSFTIAVVIFSFQGKNLMDWALALKNLAMSTVLLRFLLILITDWEGSDSIKFWQWTFVAGAYILTLVVLAREHVFYKNRNIVKSLKKRNEDEVNT